MVVLARHVALAPGPTLDSWYGLIFLSLFLTIALSLISKYLNKNKKRKLHLPPGPPSPLLLFKLLFQCRSLLDLLPFTRQLVEKYGPIITLRIGIDDPLICIADRRMAHQLLIHRGAALSDRPVLVEPTILFTNNGREITTAKYGPYWRILRRNMSTEMMNQNRLKLFAPARRWALQILLADLRNQAKTQAGVVVAIESIKYAIFGLAVFICFGEKLDKASIRQIQEIQHFAVASTIEFPIFSIFPTITKFIFRKKWNKLVDTRKTQEEKFFHLIQRHDEQKSLFVSYTDTLRNLRLPEENDQKLKDGDIVSLCAEFLDAGSEPTENAIEWIMAELVKNPDVQSKLFDEIKELVRDHEKKEIITEEELRSLPYLKAVVMEGLRRHPPSHVVSPHTVNEDIELEGYLLPKGCYINFMIADIGRDEKTWKDPLQFKPERFLHGGEGEKTDMRGIAEIKMMPFGAGRRMCTGFEMALLHVEYIVANLIWEFEWKPVEGEEIDMSERVDFGVVMKNHLRAAIVSRRS